MAVSQPVNTATGFPILKKCQKKTKKHFFNDFFKKNIFYY